MKDPNETTKDQQQKRAGDEVTAPEDQKENGNWDENQQVDEEGNEVDPDDIK